MSAANGSTATTERRFSAFVFMKRPSIEPTNVIAGIHFGDPLSDTALSCRRMPAGGIDIRSATVAVIQETPARVWKSGDWRGGST